MTATNRSVSARLYDLLQLRREAAAGFRIAFKADDAEAADDFRRELHALAGAIDAETLRTTAAR